MKSITTKLLIWLIFSIFLLLCILLYHQHTVVESHFHTLVERQASMALQFDLSIRKYAANNIRPLMYELLGQDEFLPATMSTSYIARSIFEDVRKEFPEYIIKFSSDNPRNPANKAGPEELKIIKLFNENPRLKRWEGIITINGKRYMGKFSARRMEKTCLRCHGDPNDAPASLIKLYGDKAGFYRPLGEVIGMDTIAIPISKITEGLWIESKNTFLVIIGALFLFFFSTAVTMKLLIIKRIERIAGHFQQISIQKDYSRIEPIQMGGKDEISQMAKGFNLLTGKLDQFYGTLENKVALRTKALKAKNEQLKKEIENHRETVKALRDSEARFKALHNASFGGIAIHDKGIILDCNKGLSEMTGYSVPELIGMDGLRLIAEKSRNAVMNNIVAGYEKPYEANGLRKNGEEFPIRIEARNIPYQGKRVRTVEFRDLTEQRNMEERIRQSQKMESIGTLAGGIAHDFNNLLFPIVGCTEMLLEDIPEDSPLRNNLNAIFKGAMRAKELVSQILAFSRHESNEVKLMRMQPVIKEALQLIRSTIPTSIEITSSIDHDCGPIKADPTQIHQVVMNLATNAYHAMEDTGGELKVSLKEIKLGEQDVMRPDMEPGPYACLTVADTGTGIDEKIQGKIFDPYFTTKEQGKGTGMGLSVIHGIVQSADGSIQMNSVPGEGTEFHVYLPVMISSTEQQETQTKEQIQHGTESILLVDDEDVIAILEKEMLERLGYSVVSRTSSVEALEAFRANPDKFDMVITDLAMPNMTGDKLASELVKIRPDIPILLCTGFSQMIPEEKANTIGIQGILMKPIVMKDLSDKMREVLDNSEGSG
jgi:PAS domain S-box-containing protein